MALFDVSTLTPHGFCLAWDPALLRLHVVSDALIAISYFSIPLALGYFLTRRKDMAFSWVFWLFAIFIMGCGATHLFDIWTLWNADYGPQGLVKGLTAIVSVATAVLLWPLIPKALTLPSPAQLRLANDRLQEEVEQKEAALEALRQATAERQRTEDMLRQSQKMQSIGQLTGGIAHDFNNLLMVIQGNLDMMRTRAGDENWFDKYISRSLRSVQHGKKLNNQLLSFARQQSLQPVAFDLNRRIREMSDLLPSTLGHGIVLDLQLACDLPPAEADPNQLESALLNLAINARDAMPEGGTLTIQTADVMLDAEALASAGEAKPGRYVAFSVADTGIGMTPEVRAAAFEPFFTTKPIGSGSGLGLSQIYGFVQQSRGHVTLESEVGRGTVVTVYLRRSESPVRADLRQSAMVS